VLFHQKNKLLYSLIGTFFVCLLVIPRQANADENIIWATSGDDWVTYGRDADNNFARVQKFTVSGDADRATPKISTYRDQNPTGYAIVQIVTDSAGSPSTTVLGSSQLLGSSLTAFTASCGGKTTFPQITGLSLTNGTSYWLKLLRSDALDVTDNYRVCDKGGTSTTEYGHVKQDGTYQHSTAYGDIFGELDLLSPSPSSPVNFGSTTVASSTLQLVGSTTMGFAILITMAFLSLITYIYNSFFRKQPWRHS